MTSTLEPWNNSLPTWDVNTTMTTLTEIMSTQKRLTSVQLIILTLVFFLGIVGNISALIILFYKDKRRNHKHLLMLRCLAVNDLVALLGQLIQMYVATFASSIATQQYFCALRILWRTFGLFSGGVAIVMAVERWLALTRPFVYQKHVTYPRIVQFMVIFWIAALTLTSLPLFGFGLWYDNGQCARYREAKQPVDIAYAYLSFFFGTVLCLSIVWFNLAVSRVLGKFSQKNKLLRRCSRAASHNKAFSSSKSFTLGEIGTTSEERAFAKLMAVLSTSFVICWMPHMITIPVAQYYLSLKEATNFIKKSVKVFFQTADILLGVHFTLDPYFYVLLRVPSNKFSLLKHLCHICWPARSRSSSSSDHHDHGEDPPTPITEVPLTSIIVEHQDLLHCDKVTL
ncbi:rhodopsin, GQ-coupled [Microplitis demolitor]|uniref:rhodopsin, GQ-coupled n=1 Tax=Microplitis demolitor TaxID=69319 RepID=UPI0004CDD899|nr:rhodopsin, GQ-coupled [Microplitis demolitor]